MSTTINYIETTIVEILDACEPCELAEAAVAVMSETAIRVILSIFILNLLDKFFLCNIFSFQCLLSMSDFIGNILAISHS